MNIALIGVLWLVVGGALALLLARTLRSQSAALRKLPPSQALPEPGRNVAERLTDVELRQRALEKEWDEAYAKMVKQTRALAGEAARFERSVAALTEASEEDEEPESVPPGDGPPSRDGRVPPVQQILDFPGWGGGRAG